MSISPIVKSLLYISISEIELISFKSSLLIPVIFRGLEFMVFVKKK